MSSDAGHSDGPGYDTEAGGRITGDCTRRRLTRTGLAACAAVIFAFAPLAAGCPAPPRYGDCEITCAESGVCPSGLECGTDGFCYRQAADGAQDACRVRADAGRGEHDAGASGQVLAVTAGLHHTCALTSDGGARCWGEGGVGQLGYGDTATVGATNTPADKGDIELGGTPSQLHAGGWHTCAVASAGLRCWGSNDKGQLGYGDTEDVGDTAPPTSRDVVELGGQVVTVSLGRDHTCALIEDGDLRCFGLNTRGQLGYGHTDDIGDDEVPADVEPVDLGGSPSQIVAGGLRSCALLSGSGDVRCWGSGLFGELGYGHTDDIGDDEAPADVDPVDLGAPASRLTAGESHTCALVDGGRVRCWGNNEFGQLGYGHTDTIGDTESPASAGDVEVGGAVEQIWAGGFHTCALLEGGALRCWGRNEHGQLGYGHTINIGDKDPPASAGDVPVGGKVEDVALGIEHTCVLLESGSVRCWGNGEGGRLGYGNTESIHSAADAGDVPVL